MRTVSDKGEAMADTDRSRVLVIRHESDSPVGPLEAAAARFELGLDVRTVDRERRLPAELGPERALVVLGARYGVRDAPKWPHLYTVANLIRQAAERGVPALGICLGAQVAADALGGSVRTGEKGPELGWVEVRPTEQGRADPVASEVGEGMPLFQWHHDVFEPPAGAVPLLTSDRYPNQAFRLGSVWAVQAHPEVDPPGISAWCRSQDGREDLEASGLSEEDLLGDAAVRTRSARRLLDAWFRIVAGTGSAESSRRTGGER